MNADAVWDAWRAARMARPALTPAAFAREHALAHGLDAAEVLDAVDTMLAVEEAAPLPSLLSVLQAGPEAGQRFAGFRLVSDLGEGSTGMVFEAIDEREGSDGARVALKILNPLLGGTRTRREVLKREARIVGELDHEGIVRLIDSGVERGYAWIATELVEGEPLGVLIDAELTETERRELALDVGLQVCAALEHAHAKGLVHRDLKPANLMRDEAGRVRVLDFGLARVDGAAFAVSRTGEAVGTPLYMPPEQLRGERGVDARADLYSLGLVLLELATGRRLSLGVGALATLDRIASGRERFPRHAYQGLPEALAGVLSRCLEPNRDDRYASAAAMRADLAAVRDGRPPALRRIRSGRRAGLWARRKPGRAITLGVTVAALSLFIAWVWRMARAVDVTLDVWPRTAVVALDEELDPSGVPRPESLRPGKYEAHVELRGREHVLPFDVRPSEPRALFLPVGPPYDQPAVFNELPDGAFAYVAVAVRPADREDHHTPFPIRVSVGGPPEAPIADGFVTLALGYGEHELTIRSDGYREHVETVDIGDGRLRCLQVFLTPENSDWTWFVVGSPLEASIEGSLELENLELGWETTTQDRFTETSIHRVGLRTIRPGEVGRASFELDLPWPPAEVQVLRLGHPEMDPSRGDGLLIEAGPAGGALVPIFVRGRVGHAALDWGSAGPSNLEPPTSAELSEAMQSSTRLAFRYTVAGPTAWGLRTNALPRRGGDGRVSWDPALVIRARPEGSEPDAPDFELSGVPYPAATAPKVVDVASARFAFDRGPVDALVPCSIATGGDVDGDGVDDLALAWVTERGWRAEVRSGVGGHLLLDPILGEEAGDRAGVALALVPGADGRADLLVGCGQDPRDTDARGYLRLYSGQDGALLDQRYGERPGEELGQRLTALGDFDGDGAPDAACAAWEYSAGGWGHARVVRLSDLEDVQVWSGREQADHFGARIAAPGDVDGDGLPDLLVSTPDADAEWWDSGRIDVFSGGSAKPVLTRRGLHSFALLGRTIAPAGDVDGDGCADVLAAFLGPNAAGGESGTVLFSGATGGPLRQYLAREPAKQFWPDATDVDLDGEKGDGLADHLVRWVVKANDEPTTHHAIVYSARTGEPLLELAASDFEHPLVNGPRVQRGGEERETLLVGLVERPDGAHVPLLVERP